MRMKISFAAADPGGGIESPPDVNIRKRAFWWLCGVRDLRGEFVHRAGTRRPPSLVDDRFAQGEIRAMALCEGRLRKIPQGLRRNPQARVNGCSFNRPRGR
jgi:hypothetical protein